MEGAAETCHCGSKGLETRNAYVYAIGRIEPRFSRSDVEKEFLQVLGRHGNAEPIDRSTLLSILADGRHRYLVREACWILTVANIDTYVLRPRYATDFDLLVESITSIDADEGVDLVIGTLGQFSEPSGCGGLRIPIVEFDQIYSFDLASYVRSISGIEPSHDSEHAAKELFRQLTQMRPGDSDEGRALNYLAVRYPGIYTSSVAQKARELSLLSLRVERSLFQPARGIVDVIFTYAGPQASIRERHFVRVDVAHKFPYLVNEMSPYAEDSL
jgi:hypothetical protein